MHKFSKWFPVLTIFLSGLCLAGYLSIDALNFNARMLVVLFWSAFFCSLISLCLVRKGRLWPMLASFCTWGFLWPTAESVMVWSAWWFNGFGP
jgi:hypothetical protein